MIRNSMKRISPVNWISGWIRIEFLDDRGEVVAVTFEQQPVNIVESSKVNIDEKKQSDIWNDVFSEILDQAKTTKTNSYRQRITTGSTRIYRWLRCCLVRILQ